jgi:glycosyltransferase involved in cell wall biosynthesis
VARSVSCTVLAYNEEESLEQAVEDVHAALAALGRPFEVLIVDDGSTDRTAEIGAALEACFDHVRLLRHGRNLGPGSAILTGIRNARCDNICFHPADQQVDFRQVAAMVPLLDDADIVVVSRSHRPGYTRMRLLSSQVYITLARALFGLEGFQDFNFIYLFRRELFDDMPIDSDGVFLCTEILVRAIRKGARVAHAEAECLPRTAGTSKVYRPRVIAKTLREMLGFWARTRRVI